MANANVSRPGQNQQTAGKLEPQIPKGIKLVTQQDGRVVRQTDYESGTIRRTNVFSGDHLDAAAFIPPKSAALVRAELKEELRAELLAEQTADDDGLAPASAEKSQEQAEVLIKATKPRRKSQRVVKNAVRAAAAKQAIVDAAADDEVDK